MDKNHYITLGVSEKASQEEIKKAYLRKTWETHPGKFFGRNGRVVICLISNK
jgi:curved DNA-binding protein CbpA